jgi:hypothetical protein
MKYPNIKKAKLSRAQIARVFGFANLHSFNATSANKRYMQGLDECLKLEEENKQITKKLKL